MAPASPPKQAKFPGRNQPKPHLKNLHEITMKRPAEHLHLAGHCLHGHVDSSNSDNSTVEEGTAAATAEGHDPTGS